MTFLTTTQTSNQIPIPDWAGYLFILAFITYVTYFISSSFRKDSIATQTGFDDAEKAGSIQPLTKLELDEVIQTLTSHQLIGPQVSKRLINAWRSTTEQRTIVIRVPSPPLWLWGSSQFQETLGFIYTHDLFVSDSTLYLSSHGSHRGRYLKKYNVQSRVDCRPRYYELSMPIVKHSSVPILERYSKYNPNAVDMLLQIADSCHSPQILACRGQYVYVGIQTAPRGIEGTIQHTPERIRRGLHEWNESQSASASSVDA